MSKGHQMDPRQRSFIEERKCLTAVSEQTFEWYESAFGEFSGALPTAGDGISWGATCKIRRDFPDSGVTGQGGQASFNQQLPPGPQCLFPMAPYRAPATPPPDTQAEGGGENHRHFPPSTSPDWWGGSQPPQANVGFILWC